MAWVIVRNKFNILGIARGLGPINQRLQWQPHPRNHHRPAFHTAHAVNTLLQRCQLHQLLNTNGFALLHRAFNFDRPRRRFEQHGLTRRVFLAGAKLVIIVITGHILKAGQFFFFAKSGLLKVQRLRRIGLRGQQQACGCGTSCFQHRATLLK